MASSPDIHALHSSLKSSMNGPSALRGEPVDVLYIDFNKAFDSVPHQRLACKLETYGIKGHLRRWTSSFLSGRSQRVVVRGCHSPLGSMSGVPQKTVLGLALLIIYINDIPDCEKFN